MTKANIRRQRAAERRRHMEETRKAAESCAKPSAPAGIECRECGQALAIIWTKNTVIRIPHFGRDGNHLPITTTKDRQLVCLNPQCAGYRMVQFSEIRW